MKIISMGSKLYNSGNELGLDRDLVAETLRWEIYRIASVFYGISE